MKYAVIDTETSGLFDFKKPADAPGQPRLATVSIITLTAALEVEAENHFMVKPDGWELTPEAAAVNGLTMEQLAAEGIPVKEVLDCYTSLVLNGWVIVAYNAQFDTKMLRGELRRAGMDDLFEKTPNVCLMRASTSVCQIQGKKGFKFPKLSEACAFFKIEQPAAHSSGGDARSAVEILRHLVALKALPEPEVHYAANRPDSAAAPAKPVEAKADTKEEAY